MDRGDYDDTDGSNWGGPIESFRSPEEFYTRYPALVVGHAFWPGHHERGLAPFGSDELFVKREQGSPVEGDWTITLVKPNVHSHPYWLEDEEPVIGTVTASNNRLPEIMVLAAEVDLRPMARALRRLLPSNPSLEQVGALVERLAADQ